MHHGCTGRPNDHQDHQGWWEDYLLMMASMWWCIKGDAVTSIYSDFFFNLSLSHSLTLSLSFFFCRLSPLHLVLSIDSLIGEREEFFSIWPTVRHFFSLAPLSVSHSCELYSTLFSLILSPVLVVCFLFCFTNPVGELAAKPLTLNYTQQTARNEWMRERERNLVSERERNKSTRSH